MTVPGAMGVLLDRIGIANGWDHPEDFYCGDESCNIRRGNVLIVIDPPTNRTERIRVLIDDGRVIYAHASWLRRIL